MILGDLILGANVLGSGESVTNDQALPATILGTVTYPVTGEQTGAYTGQPAGLATIAPLPQTVGGASTDTTVFTPADILFYAQPVAFNINSNTYTQFSSATVSFFATNYNSAQYTVNRTAFSAADVSFSALNLGAIVTANSVTQFSPARFGFHFHDFYSVQVTSTSTVFAPAELNFSAQSSAIFLPIPSPTLFSPAEINMAAQLYTGFQPTNTITQFSSADFGFIATDARGRGIILGNPKYIFDLKYSVKSFDYIL